jgi:hypothetical protein
MRKLNLYFGTVKSATGGRRIMAWANSREHALDLVEAALTATETVQGSVVGPLMSLSADVMKPGVYVEATRCGSKSRSTREDMDSVPARRGSR